MTTPLGADTFELARFTCSEAISRPYELRLELVADATTSVAFDALLGQSVTVTVDLADGGKRYLNGIVRTVAKGATTQVSSTLSVTAYRMTVVPKLWLLTRRAQSRIFQQLSVPDILKKVLTGLTTKYELQGTYQPRDYCAQYRETDFDFAARLMEEEGIYYFFQHANGTHTMVVADTPVSHASLPAGSTIQFYPLGGGLRPEDRIHAWEKSQDLTSGKVTLWDHSFELPGNNLEATEQIPASATVGTVSHKLRVGGNDQLEMYDYPGEYAKRFDGTAPGGSDRASDVQKIFQDNTRTAKVRAQQIEVEAVVVQGESDCRQMATGYKFTLSGHADGDGDYVLATVEHEASLEGDARSGRVNTVYTNRFTCLPAAVPFRPQRVTPRPVVRGCQTAVVVGPQGEEIFTDKFGRVKVQFHWDREGKKDASSSCWVRVATSWAGRQWGAVHLPRVGQEVVIDFLEGDPDRPLLTGSVYNAEQMPPYTLPANRTQSGIKSRSTPQGGADNFNEIRFEDKKGEEHVSAQAEKDLKVLVKNDETRDVGHDRTTTIKNNDTETVTEGNYSLTVSKGNFLTEVSEGNYDVKVTKGYHATNVDEGQCDLFVKKGDYNVTVGEGSNTVKVKTDQTTTVEGSSALTVTKKRDVTIKEGNDTLTVNTGNVTIKATGGKVTIEAGQMIELKVGSVSIKLSASGITMMGPTFKVAATGAAEIQGAVVRMEGQAMLNLKSPMAQVNGDGMLMMKGGVTMIN